VFGSIHVAAGASLNAVDAEIAGSITAVSARTVTLNDCTVHEAVALTGGVKAKYTIQRTGIAKTLLLRRARGHFSVTSCRIIQSITVDRLTGPLDVEQDILDGDVTVGHLTGPLTVGGTAFGSSVAIQKQAGVTTIDASGASGRLLIGKHSHGQCLISGCTFQSNVILRRNTAAVDLDHTTVNGDLTSAENNPLPRLSATSTVLGQIIGPVVKLK
jgi:hypothetical protein